MTNTYYAITGTLAIVAALLKLVGCWRRRNIGTPAGLTMIVTAALWLLRYGARLIDQSDGHVSRVGLTLADPRVLMFSTALLLISSVLYAIERSNA